MFGFSNKGMDDGDGKCVGGIVGLGRSFHVEMQAHHFLHLGFVGVAVAGDGHFDLVRSRQTPRASATEIPVVMFCLKKSFSIAMTSG